LTDACAGDLAALLSYHVFVQADYAWRTRGLRDDADAVVCLHGLDLWENELTFEFVEIVKWVIRIDLRGNAGISDTVIAAIRRNMGDEKVITGSAREDSEARGGK
jgi:hypothetical protein